MSKSATYTQISDGNMQNHDKQSKAVNVLVAGNLPQILPLAGIPTPRAKTHPRRQGFPGPDCPYGSVRTRRDTCARGLSAAAPLQLHRCRDAIRPGAAGSLTRGAR